jgi:MYXO-CTERM domain-containing protein
VTTIARSVLAIFLAWPTAALAAIADFRVSEVFPGTAGNPAVRFIELSVPEGTAGNCLFPTTRIEIFDSKGELLGALAPFAATVCYAAGSFFLLATPEAAAFFGVERDSRLDVPLPREGGQVCFASSQTRYDCARWGPVAEEDALRFLRNTDDATASPPIPEDIALARTGDTGVAAADFQLQSPTPRQPNDGTVWIPPDAGELPDGGGDGDADGGDDVDAAPPADAPLPDAPDFRRPDARPIVRVDASFFDPAFLDADPGGGAACGCRAGRGAPPLWILLAGLALLLLRRP